MAQRDPTRLGGCLMMALMCLIASLLFLANGAVVSAIYAELSPRGPDWLRHPKVGQVLMFLAPVVLLVGQWWLFDFVSSLVSSRIRRP